MNSERTRVIAIFGAVLLLAAGAGVYFVKVYRPKQMLGDARDEITAWEVRWQGARDCLLGPTPGSPVTREALAIHEMSPDPWSRGGCTPLISKLSRGEAPDTGIRDVEAAWTELDAAAAKAAQAFATHVASSTTMEGLKDDPLPAALDRLDAARAKLRAAAELPAATLTGAALPAAQILPITDQGTPLESLDVVSIPSSQAFVLFGKTSNRLVEVVLAPGKPPAVGRVGPGTVRALPDTSWGASPGDKGIRVGAFDGEGAMPSPAELALADHPSIAAVGGTPQDGTVAYGNDKQMVIAHVTAAGVKTDPPLLGDLAFTATDGDGRVAVAWVESRGGGEHARLFAPGAPPQDLPLSGPLSTAICLTRSGIAIPSEVGLDLLGCTAEGSIARGGGQPQRFVVCTDSCRNATLPKGAPSFATTTLVGGKLVAIVEHGGVLAVWREGGDAKFYALPEAARPVLAHEWPAMALTDGKVIDVLARGAKTFVVVRIPAS